MSRFFSTNLCPVGRPDSGVPRHIAHGIHFSPVSRADYVSIWEQVCGEQGVEFDPAVLEFALTELHARHRVPLLPVHPRDLIGLALDQTRPKDGTIRITNHMLATAWKNYFGNLDVAPELEAAPAGQGDSIQEDL